MIDYPRMLLVREDIIREAEERIGIRFVNKTRCADALADHDKKIRDEVIEEIKEWVLTSRPDTIANYKCSDGVVRSRPLYDCSTICKKLEQMKGKQK